MNLDSITTSSAIDMQGILVLLLIVSPWVIQSLHYPAEVFSFKHTSGTILFFRSFLLANNFTIENILLLSYAIVSDMKCFFLQSIKMYILYLHFHFYLKKVLILLNGLMFKLVALSKKSFYAPYNFHRDS